MNFVWFILVLLIFETNLMGKTFKVGTMVPQGTEYANLLEKMGKEIQVATEKRVKLKYYFGGLAGDEPDVMRKIRIGQLHGGIFTAKALSDVFGDVRILEVPFSFKSRAQSSQVLDALRVNFAEGFKAKGFQILGIYETGEIYIVTKEKVNDVSGLKGQKLWMMEGDQLAEVFTKSLDLVAVPIALPDVLTSLSTGLIQASYAPALGIIALQWHTKVSYLIEPPFAFHFQGFLLNDKSWDEIKKEDRQVIEGIVKNYEKKISEINLQEADEALEAIKKQGVKVVTWPETDIKKLTELRRDVLKKLTGSLLDEKVVDQFNKMIK